MEQNLTDFSFDFNHTVALLVGLLSGFLVGINEEIEIIGKTLCVVCMLAML
jgi:hypothetical protein